MDEPVDGTVPAAEYPKELERTITLEDGTRVFIRPIRPDDAPRLTDAYGRLSKTTAYQRFFTTRRSLPPDWARYFAAVDYRRRMALIAERETVDQPDLIGVARYELADASDVPEIALVVLDGWQGRGLGAVLLHAILAAGQARGFRRFRARVLLDNQRMLKFLSRHTNIKERSIEMGVVEFVLEPRG